MPHIDQLKKIKNNNTTTVHQSNPSNSSGFLNFLMVHLGGSVWLQFKVSNSKKVQLWTRDINLEIIFDGLQLHLPNVCTVSLLFTSHPHWGQWRSLTSTSHNYRIPFCCSVYSLIETWEEGYLSSCTVIDSLFFSTFENRKKNHVRQLVNCKLQRRRQLLSSQHLITAWMMAERSRQVRYLWLCRECMLVENTIERQSGSQCIFDHIWSQKGLINLTISSGVKVNIYCMNV